MSNKRGNSRMKRQKQAEKVTNRKIIIIHTLYYYHFTVNESSRVRQRGKDMIE